MLLRKIIEHTVFRHISPFLEANNLIDHRQHRISKVLSTTAQLLENVRGTTSVSGMQGQVRIIFLDLQKDFDRVSHPKLLSELA